MYFHSNKNGFTLIEVMVSIVVLAMMAILIQSISSSNLDSIDRTEKRDKVFQTARFAMDRMIKDINMAFLVADDSLIGKTKDESKVENAFIGEDKGGFDTLNFNTFAHWRMFRDVKESDQAEIGYYVTPDPDEDGQFRLMRRESPFLDNDVTIGGKAYPIAENLREFQLRYYNPKNNEWTSSWNTKEVDVKGLLPRGVEIVLVFPDPVEPDEKERNIKFKTIAFIGLWKSPIRF